MSDESIVFRFWGGSALLYRNHCAQEHITPKLTPERWPFPDAKAGVGTAAKHKCQGKTDCSFVSVAVARAKAKNQTIPPLLCLFGSKPVQVLYWIVYGNSTAGRESRNQWIMNALNLCHKLHPCTLSCWVECSALVATGLFQRLRRQRGVNENFTTRSFSCRNSRCRIDSAMMPALGSRKDGPLFTSISVSVCAFRCPHGRSWAGGVLMLTQ